MISGWRGALVDAEAIRHELQHRGEGLVAREGWVDEAVDAQPIAASFRAGLGVSSGVESVAPPVIVLAAMSALFALVETGATRANAVERDSEDGAVWEVEVTKADGSTVDVRLDTDMHVVKVETDSEG